VAITRKTLSFLFLLITAAYSQQQRVAIVGTEDDGEPSIGVLELSHLTDKLREIASNALPKDRYGIMTQQSMVAMLGTQEQAAKTCREAACLVELGRKINADYIAQARIGRFEDNLTVKTELYEVRSGNLAASFAGDAKSAKGLLSIMEAKSPAMFKAMLGETSEPAKPKPQAQPQPQPKAVLLVGSKNSDKYHNPSCTWAGRISGKNLVTFASKEEAERAGYVPCKVCKGK
jgi:hypothetical protein